MRVKGAVWKFRCSSDSVISDCAAHTTQHIHHSSVTMSSPWSETTFSSSEVTFRDINHK